MKFLRRLGDVLMPGYRQKVLQYAYLHSPTPPSSSTIVYVYDLDRLFPLTYSLLSIYIILLVSYFIAFLPIKHLPSVFRCEYYVILIVPLSM